MNFGPARAVAGGVCVLLLWLFFASCGGGGSTSLCPAPNCAPQQGPPPRTSVNVTVDVMANRHGISSYIYGTNFPNNTTYIQNNGTTLVRTGGNANTRDN